MFPPPPSYTGPFFDSRNSNDITWPLYSVQEDGSGLAGEIFKVVRQENFLWARRGAEQERTEEEDDDDQEEVHLLTLRCTDSKMIMFS